MVEDENDCDFHLRVMMPYRLLELRGESRYDSNWIQQLDLFQALLSHRR